ncbi:MAG: hypothetical protein R2827_15060 [Bdellovibrionales bacterium]
MAVDQKFDYEIVLVDDTVKLGSDRRAMWQESKSEGVNFSRNFGQHKAITVGLQYAKGDRVCLWIAISRMTPSIFLICSSRQTMALILSIQKKIKENMVFLKICSPVCSK